MSAKLPAWAGFLAPALPLIAFLLAAFFWLSGDMGSYRAILAMFGMYPDTPPFLDTHAILSALQCKAAGIDVMQANPCDTLRRPHMYGSLWLRLAPLGFTTGLTQPIGFALDLMFFAGLFALPKARSWREVLVLSLACLSGAVVFLLERANNDIVVWLIALAMARLLLRGGLARAAAYALGSLAALLKLYPLVLLSLLMREHLIRCLAIGLPLGVFLVALLLGEASAPMQRFRYTNYLTDAFGAWNIGQSVLANFADAPWQKPAMALLVGAMAVYGISLSVRMARRFDLLRHVGALAPYETWLASAGAVMLVGCFFAGPNLAYRAVHLLLVLPAALALWRGAEDRASRTLFAGLAWAIVWCLWSEAVHNHVMHGMTATDMLSSAQLALVGIATGLRELAWWWMISTLMALLGCIFLHAPAGRDFCRLVGIRLAT